MEQIEVAHDVGFGFVSRNIMRNKELSLQAKTIYSYLCSFAGNSGRAYPSVSLILEELQISKNTFYKYQKELIDNGVLFIRQDKSNQGKFGKSIYFIAPCTKYWDTDNQPCTKYWDTVNCDTNNNISLNNNNYINSSSSNTKSSNIYTNIYIRENDDDNNQDNIFDFIEKTWGITLNPAEFEVINNWEDNELTRHAIKVSALNRAYNTRYVEKILQSYKRKGLKTIKDVELHEEKRSGKSNAEVPVWLNNENKVEKASLEEKEEMERLLSEFGK